MGRKGEITLKILEAIGSAVVGTGELLEAFLGAGYGASLSKLEYKHSLLRRERAKRSRDGRVETSSKERYYKMLYKLKCDGLIEEKSRGGKKMFSLTNAGKQKAITLKQQQQNHLPPPNYSTTPSQQFTIIVFDVPEKERRKRDWLRAVLKRLRFAMIQKSVWVGKIKVPKEFLDDLSKLRMLNFVEIFEISKTGSLRHLT